MNKSTHHKGFSLVEMTIVLLLSSITVSLAYTGLRYYTKQTRSYRTKQSLLSEHQLFISQFHYDWWKAEQVTSTSNQVILRSENRHITYSLSPSTIFRTLNGAETSFQLDASLEEIHTNELNLVSSLSIKFQIKEEFLLLTEHKTYLPSLFLNQ